MKALWPLVLALDQRDASSLGMVLADLRTDTSRTMLRMEESARNFCHGLSLTDFTKVGCGSCTPTCNEYATATEKNLFGTDIASELGTDFTVAGCLQRCRDDHQCK